MEPDWDTLADLFAFARIEQVSGDIEPWAAILTELHRSGVLDVEQAHWAVCLYNTFDSLESAFNVFDRWGSPAEWAAAPDRDDVADLAQFPIMQERRNLFGGKVIRRMQSHVDLLGGMDQAAWLRQPLLGSERPGVRFRLLTEQMRLIWGVGRQAAFEWAEFVQKVAGWPIDCEDAQLWESEGPRRSLQRLYGNAKPTSAWLDEAAHTCRSWLAAQEVDLPWVDFETVICDFNVMRDGRYYPGRHLAALTGEIDAMPPVWRDRLRIAWHEVIPPGWADIAPGIDKTKMPVYRDTGRIITEP